MLKYLKRWLGLERTASREPLAGVNNPRRTAARQAGAARNHPRTSPPKKPGPAKPRRPVDVLDNPRLSLERPDEGFDPYNTGAFNRGQSWERIGKKKR